MKYRRHEHVQLLLAMLFDTAHMGLRSMNYENKLFTTARDGGHDVYLQ
jgi:hypothetical protein